MSRKRIVVALVALVALTSLTASAQDASTVISNASKAMGVDNLNSVMFYGSGANFGLGQNNNANGPWPRTNLNDYTRAIDFTQPASRATWVTYAAPVTGGPAVQANGQQNIAAANNAWAQHLEIWITPWGFLKGASANNATAKSQTVAGKRYSIVTWNTPQKAPSGESYRVVGYINPQNLVDKVETWLENPIFGDMLVEGIYSDYRDNNGFKFPGTIVQKRGGWPTFEAQLLGAIANPRNIQQLLRAPAPQRGGGAPAGAPAIAAPAALSEKLADGVYRITAGGVGVGPGVKNKNFLF